MDFYKLKRWHKRLEPLMWRERELALAIYLHGFQKGVWIGKRESDDIWPIDSHQPSPAPWSDYQIDFYEKIKASHRALQNQIVEVAKRLV